MVWLAFLRAGSQVVMWCDFDLTAWILHVLLAISHARTFGVRIHSFKRLRVPGRRTQSPEEGPWVPMSHGAEAARAGAPGLEDFLRKER